eukprot:1161030-Pelagomonas_calceolata.AAC.8
MLAFAWPEAFNFPLSGFQTTHEVLVLPDTNSDCQQASQNPWKLLMLSKQQGVLPTFLLGIDGNT